MLQYACDARGCARGSVLLLGLVQPPVHIRVAQHRLDIIPSLGKRNCLDELSRLAIVVPTEPLVSAP